MKSTIQWKGKMAFEAYGDTSGHALTMDASPDIGGENQGPRPMEVLLHSVGVCTGIDIVNILNRMRITVDDYEMEVSGDRAEDHPRRFTHIHIVYKFKGEIPEAKLERAVKLSTEKYCSVSHSLGGEVTYDIELNGEIMQ